MSRIKQIEPDISPEDVLGLLKPDMNILEKGRERQGKIWRNEETDFLPIILSGAAPEMRAYPRYNMREQFYDKKKMLTEHTWGLIAQARGKSDGQLSVRVNFGVGFIPSIFGLKSIIFEDKMPWVERHLSKDEIIHFEFPDDIRNCGLMPKALEYIAYFREMLGDKARIYLSDTQGPFDIAHLVRGEEIFIDIYDDPVFVHNLMELSTRAYIEATKALKAAIGEELNGGYHGQLYMEGGGVRICEDATTLLSSSLAKEFAIPYTEMALKPFGGGWIHYCGNGKHILDLFLGLGDVKGINFGNPEMYDYREVMSRIAGNGKFYYGGWPMNKGESVRDYFKRVLKPVKGMRKSLIFIPHGGAEEDWKDTGNIISLWHSLQG
ncbi:MAG: hypothetical protein HY350_00695 [Candidatus Omnitrophica bacterium]|nr:hypothetical protein [Candidatus Omnitrophota bacterium]